MRRKKNLFGWSAAEKVKAKASRKRISAGVTEARGAGYKLGRGKSDEHFSEWLDRKDLEDQKDSVKERLGRAFSDGYNKGQEETKPKYSPYPMHVWDVMGYAVYALEPKGNVKTYVTDFDGQKKRFHRALDIDEFIEKAKAKGKKNPRPIIRVKRVKL